MLNIDRLVNDLESLRAHPHLHIQPVTPEVMFSHLRSVARGVMLATDSLTRSDFVNARRQANRNCGWEDRATGPHVEMREKGMSDEEILEEQVKVEIKMWRILDAWQRENRRTVDK
jgi:hypothetical protein